MSLLIWSVFNVCSTAEYATVEISVLSGSIIQLQLLIYTYESTYKHIKNRTRAAIAQSV
jgi:hypothetical protein